MLLTEKERFIPKKTRVDGPRPTSGVNRVLRPKEKRRDGQLAGTKEMLGGARARSLFWLIQRPRGSLVGWG
jgi:hypothetical protein